MYEVLVLDTRNLDKDVRLASDVFSISSTSTFSLPMPRTPIICMKEYNIRYFGGSLYPQNENCVSSK